jgi:hypothetical protein
MKKILLPFIVLCVLFLSMLALCAEPLTMDIQTYDFVPGELVMGARELFQLVIQNNTGSTVKLAIAGNNYYYDSPYWKVTVNGPLDPKCILPPSVERVALAHNPTEMKVLPGQNKFTCPAGAKVGEPGSYSISIEYDGSTAPEGCYRGKLRTPERSYTVKPLLGADAELYAAWKKQNPEKSICFFPVGMQPDAMKAEVLLNNYPTSTLTGWALLDYMPQGAGVFVKNATADKAIMAAITRDPEGLDQYWRLNSPLRQGENFIDRPTVMKKVMQAGEAFARSHPDFLFSGYVLAKAGFNALGIADYQSACRIFKDALELQWHAARGPDNALMPNKEGTENALVLLKKQGYCKN